VLGDALPDTSLSACVRKARGETPAQTDALSPCPAWVAALVPITPDPGADVASGQALWWGLELSALLSRGERGARCMRKVGKTAGSAACSWPLLVYTASTDVWLTHTSLNKPFLPHMVHEVPKPCMFCCCCTCILVAGSKYSQ